MHLFLFSEQLPPDEEYFSSAKIVWDNTKMHKVYYDEHLLLPEELRFVNGIGVHYHMCYENKLPPISQNTSLGDIICGTKCGRTSDDERILFIAGGMPVWDVGWGYEIYQNAKKMGLGQTLKLWDSPYLA